MSRHRQLIPCIVYVHISKPSGKKFKAPDMVYIDGDRLQDTIRGYWHYYGHKITRGWNILYPSSCLSMPCSFFRPRPAISHSAQSWNVLLKISVCAHLSSLSPWGQEIVIHCSLFHPCFHLQIESNELEWWNSNIWMIVILYTYLIDKVDEQGHREYM